MKFKKHICLFLAILLLVSNGGFAFNVHYCGGQIASVTLKSVVPFSDSKKACCEKIEKKDTCCKDKVVHFEKKSDDTTLKSFVFECNAGFLIPEFHSVLFPRVLNFKNTLITSYYCNAHAPPLFKLYSQYIFYA